MKTPSKIIATLALGFLLPISTAQAAITLSLTNASGTFGGSIGGTGFYEVSSLTDGTPTESDPSNGLTGRAQPSGSLTGVANTDSFGFFYDTFAGSTLTGSDLAATGVGNSLLNSNGTGVASADGNINGSGRGIFFQFDFTNFATDYNLRITDATATLNAGTGGQLQILVGSSTLTGGAGGTLSGSGLSVYNLGGLTGTGLTIDIADGDYVYFRNTGSASDTFRLSSLTFEAVEAIPEPSSSALVMLGLGGMFLLRRRS